MSRRRTLAAKQVAGPCGSRLGCGPLEELGIARNGDDLATATGGRAHQDHDQVVAESADVSRPDTDVLAAKGTYCEAQGNDRGSA